MPFNSLILASIIPDRKLFENNVGIKIDTVKNDETIILFLAENKIFQEVFLNKFVSGKPNSKCCDAICLYSKTNDKSNTPPKLTITLIELKGGKNDYYSDATDQIIDTRDSMEMGIKKIIESDKINKYSSISWRAIVVSNSSLSDKKMNDKLSQLRNKFGKNISVLSANGSYIDIHEYII